MTGIYQQAFPKNRNTLDHPFHLTHINLKNENNYFPIFECSTVYYRQTNIYSHFFFMAL